MKKQKKPTKLDRATEGVAQDHAHASTEDIMRKRAVLNCMWGALEDEIVDLAARLAKARAARADVEARLRGLALVVGRR